MVSLQSAWLAAQCFCDPLIRQERLNQADWRIGNNRFGEPFQLPCNSLRMAVIKQMTRRGSFCIVARLRYKYSWLPVASTFSPKKYLQSNIPCSPRLRAVPSLFEICRASPRQEMSRPSCMSTFKIIVLQGITH